MEAEYAAVQGWSYVKPVLRMTDKIAHLRVGQECGKIDSVCNLRHESITINGQKKEIPVLQLWIKLNNGQRVHTRLNLNVAKTFDECRDFVVGMYCLLDVYVTITPKDNKLEYNYSYQYLRTI